MIEILIYIAFVIFSAYAGFSEAYLDLVYDDEYPLIQQWWRKYKHFVYAIPRGAMIIGLSLDNLWMTIPLALVYPFFHDGTYYESKNRIKQKELYHGGFWGYNDGGALMDFKLSTRIAMLAVSITTLFLITIDIQPLIQIINNVIDFANTKTWQL